MNKLLLALGIGGGFLAWMFMGKKKPQPQAAPVAQIPSWMGPSVAAGMSTFHLALNGPTLYAFNETEKKWLAVDDITEIESDIAEERGKGTLIVKLKYTEMPEGRNILEYLYALDNKYSHMTLRTQVVESLENLN